MAENDPAVAERRGLLDGHAGRISVAAAEVLIPRLLLPRLRQLGELVGDGLVQPSLAPRFGKAHLGEIIPDSLQPRELARAHLHFLGDKIADAPRQLRAALAHGDERFLEPPRLLGLFPVGEHAPRAVRVD